MHRNTGIRRKHNLNIHTQIIINVAEIVEVIFVVVSVKVFEFEAKYNDVSNKFKPATIEGLPNSKGDTPVNFNGYKDTTWILQHNLRKTDRPVMIKFSNLELAFASAVDSDTIEVQDCGVHLMRDTIDIKKAVTVIGVGTTKPIVLCRSKRVLSLTSSLVRC